MDIPTPARVLHDSVVEERICRRCASAYWGLGHPEGLCHGCRRMNREGRPPTGPWTQGGPKKVTP